MLVQTQDSIYFNRMATSLGDKGRLLDFATVGSTLDVGAGGGELAEHFRLAGHKVWALDGSHVAIKRIEQAYPLLNTVQAYSDGLSAYFEPESLDSIVCSAVLHEVYSYGQPGKQLDAVLDSLSSFHSLLKPGGRLLIRDGVIPADWDKEASVRFEDEGWQEFFEFYTSASPYLSPVPVYRRIWLERKGTDILVGNYGSVMELLYTYTWGWGSVQREAQELYGIFTQAEYRQRLEAAGFTVEHSEEYLQTGYPANLAHVSIFDADGVRLPLPSSNVLLVARK